jgi:hypothetical protein
VDLAHAGVAVAPPLPHALAARRRSAGLELVVLK